jgi:hypothetical protein
MALLSFARLTAMGPAVVLIVLSFLLHFSNGASHGAPLAVGARAGSSGFGPELSLALGGSYQARLGVFALGHGARFSETGIEYDADLSLRHAFLLVDWNPAGRGFRLTAGVAANRNRLRATAPLEDLLRRELPELPPVGVDLGRLLAEARVEPVGPYLGVGWGHPLRRGRWGVSLDLGAVHHGRPSVRLQVRSDLPLDLVPGGPEELERLLAAEQRALERELTDFRFLPVISLGVTYALRTRSP